MNTRHLHAVLVAVAGFMVMHQAVAQQAVIASHVGSADPRDEGFSYLFAGSPLVGPVASDLGFTAWQTGVDSAGDIALYSRNLDRYAEQFTAGEWRLQVNVRLFPAYARPSYAAGVSLYTGDCAFPLLFGTSTAGDPLVAIGSTVCSPGNIGAGYHTYELTQRVGGSDALLFCDGAYLASCRGFSYSSPAKLEWGAGQHPSVAIVANWQEVKMEFIPEPSSTTILSFATICCWCFRRAGRPSLTERVC